MAGDGRSARPTVNTAETQRSPIRVGTRRIPATGRTARDPATDDTARDDPSRRRIRRRAIPHTTTLLDAVSGDGRYGTRRAGSHAIRRRAIRHATGLTARDPARDDTAHDDHLVSGNARKCPDMPGYARNMFGRCSVIPDDVWLLGLSGDRVTGCERPNDPP